jgi:hypothetical protein
MNENKDMIPAFTHHFEIYQDINYVYVTYSVGYNFCPNEKKHYGFLTKQQILNNI